MQHIRIQVPGSRVVTAAGEVVARHMYIRTQQGFLVAAICPRKMVVSFVPISHPNYQAIIFGCTQMAG